MQKISFENYPSTDTPINADNLNDLQDNVEEEINKVAEKNLMTASLEQNITINVSSAWGYSKISLNNEFAKIGEKLTLSNGAIKIGEGINHIKVSGSIFNSGMIGDLTGHITKNIDDVISVGYSRTTGAGQWVQNVFSPKIIEVEENDEIILEAGASQTGTLNINLTGTYLTVEVID